MKNLMILVTLVSSTAFGNCVSDMMAGPAMGSLDVAQSMCRSNGGPTCNLSEIIEENDGFNYAQAWELCEKTYSSNQDVIDCIAEGNNYATCQQM